MSAAASSARCAKSSADDRLVERRRDVRRLRLEGAPLRRVVRVALVRHLAKAAVEGGAQRCRVEGQPRPVRARRALGAAPRLEQRAEEAVVLRARAGAPRAEPAQRPRELGDRAGALEELVAERPQRGRAVDPGVEHHHIGAIERELERAALEDPRAIEHRERERVTLRAGDELEQLAAQRHGRRRRRVPARG